MQIKPYLMPNYEISLRNISQNDHLLSSKLSHVCCCRENPGVYRYLPDCGLNRRHKGYLLGMGLVVSIACSNDNSGCLRLCSTLAIPGYASVQWIRSRPFKTCKPSCCGPSGHFCASPCLSPTAWH